MVRLAVCLFIAFAASGAYGHDGKIGLPPGCIASALRTHANTNPTHLKPFGGQVLDDSRRLHIFVTPDQTATVKGVSHNNYLFILATLKSGKTECSYLGNIWGLSTKTPFGGGILVNGLPLIYDAVDLDGKYQHYVYWKGEYRKVYSLPMKDMRSVLERILENPTTYKYPFNWSKDQSRYHYD